MGKPEWMTRLKHQNKQAAAHCGQICGAKLVNISELEPAGEAGQWRSTGSDPWLHFCLAEPAEKLQLRFQVALPQEEEVTLYYGYAKDGGALFPEQRLSLSAAQCRDGMTLQFPDVVGKLRLDPMEHPGSFSLRNLSFSVADAEQPGILVRENPLFCSFEKGLEILEERFARKQLDPDKTVLLFTHEMTRTGAPQLCLHLAKAMRRAGQQVILFALANGPDAERFAEEADWLFLLSPEREGLKSGLAALAEKGVCRALMNTVVSGAVAGLLHDCGYRSVALIHEMRATCEICAAGESARLLARDADVLVFPARCVQEEFEEFAKQPICGQVILRHQGLYKRETPPDREEAAAFARQLLGLPENARLVLSAGSLNYGKGADLLPQLLALCRQEAPDLAEQLHFVWLGLPTDPLFGVWLSCEIQKRGMDKQIHFAGYFDEPDAYLGLLAGADAFLLPSRDDSMPSVLLEAMACGTPTLAFKRSGGAEELLAEGRGVAVPFMEVGAMAAALCSLLQQPEKTQEMTRCAKRYVEEHAGFEEYAQRICALLEPIEAKPSTQLSGN